ncbi:alpha/beta fold hydrolase [Loktanella sp. DSM 29012]|uniref:alpha/beta fold hydrolase n=1 Tax=Loktanella sp. DSM 29012 TaxID=1881056 RepID=UPI00210E01CD|nr:alpha/beta fold hydrolase [Loktanella sp. DSM 29012]
MVGFAMAMCLVAMLSIVRLEQQRDGVSAERVILAETPVTLWRSDTMKAGPLVVVAHGYAGSRQMMQPVAIALTQAGFTVATFDFLGHGRNRAPMTGDVTSIEGTTARLVEQTLAVTEAAQDATGVVGPVSFVGHSMATDVVIRAAERSQGVAAVVAISMYSDAVTPTAPEQLLIISGAREGRLRAVALDRLRQIAPEAVEGETVTEGRIARRAVASPGVGHVGVLYSPVTLAEVRDWIGMATDRTLSGPLPRIAPWLAALLVSLIAVMWQASGLLGPKRAGPVRMGRRLVLILTAPVVPALLVAILIPPGLGGLYAFGALAGYLGTWGAVQLALLWRANVLPERPRPLAIGMLLIWGLGLFALALDRYGAAFVPVGPRLWVMWALLPGTVLFCLADAMVVTRSGWIAAGIQRIQPLIVLLGAMLIAPALGIAFTVIAVMVLFWLVYGVAGASVRRRSDPVSVGLALGIILAWSIAASTPLVAG